MEQASPSQSYDPAYFDLLFQVEESHFWFRARNSVIAMLSERLTVDLPASYRMLEIGCGTGNVLRRLERVCTGGVVVGVDLFLEGLRYAHRRTSAPLVQADMQALPFGVPFDLVGLFDVLEHMPDDCQVLRVLNDMLAEGGRLLLTVPAHPYLWSYFDEASCHCRRYRREELFRKLRETGYQVEQITYFMATIFPLVWIGRRLNALLPKPSRNGTVSTEGLAVKELRIVPVINELLTLLLALETLWLKRWQTLPCGTSLLAVARKA